VSKLQEAAFEDVIESGPFPIRFPHHSRLDQDEEWCDVEIEGESRRIRFHDYHEVYRIPGLYETIFYRTLRCNSPKTVIELLRGTLMEHSFTPEDLRVLDMGAGNGMVGEELQGLGTREIVGVDIIPEAKAAAERDRPWVYNDYLVADMTDPTQPQRQRLEQAHFNALTTVAALGFGDIPVDAFFNAYNLVADGGWLAFNIKEDFLKDDDAERSGFASLIRHITREGILQMELYKRYCHRLSIAGAPLYYIAVVAQKQRDIPRELLA
jgi:SAM-dependent methyltransferase